MKKKKMKIKQSLSVSLSLRMSHHTKLVQLLHNSDKTDTRPNKRTTCRCQCLASTCWIFSENSTLKLGQNSKLERSLYNNTLSLENIALPHFYHITMIGLK